MVNAKEKFNPYPEGIVKPIESHQIPKLDKEHQQMLQLFRQKKKLETQLKEVNEEIDKREAVLLKQINSGKKFDWCWQWMFERTNISWKDVAIKFIGKKKVNEIMARTESTKYPHIGIEGYHPRPFKKPKKLNLRKPIK
jgi:hypothetical protein